jgi:ATP-dependent Lon protease
MTHHSLVPQAPALRLPVAQIRQVFQPADVERKLARLQEAGNQREYEALRTVYERMLERGPERFQVKPSGVPDMASLYEQLPNFTEVLDDVKRHVALAQDSRDGLEVTPMLLLGPPGIGKTHFARHLAELLGTGMNLVSTTRWAPCMGCWSTTPRNASPTNSPRWPSTPARSSGSPPPTTNAAFPSPS